MNAPAPPVYGGANPCDAYDPRTEILLQKNSNCIIQAGAHNCTQPLLCFEFTSDYKSEILQLQNTPNPPKTIWFCWKVVLLITQFFSKHLKLYSNYTIFGPSLSRLNHQNHSFANCLVAISQAIASGYGITGFILRHNIHNYLRNRNFLGKCDAQGILVFLQTRLDDKAVEIWCVNYLSFCLPQTWHEQKVDLLAAG